MTNLQKLESAIREALPELMELSEGCIVNTWNNGKFRAGVDIVIPKVIPVHWEIIGHPVTLLHLLRWLEIDRIVSLRGSGTINEYQSCSRYNDDWYEITQLDLSKPLLSQQDQNVIDELVKLVK